MPSQHQQHSLSTDNSSSPSSSSTSVREMIAATRSSTLSADDDIVFRFIQGMSAEKKELLVLGFINEMSEEKKDELEREILQDFLEQSEVLSTTVADKSNGGADNTMKKNESSKNPLSILRSKASKIFFPSKKKTTASKAA